MINFIVPNNIANKLKQIGFNESCIYHYKGDINTPTFDTKTPHGYNHNELPTRLSAPTWEQLFLWIKNKHNIYYEIYSPNGLMETWEYYIRFNNSTTFLSDSYKTYEEAREMCINKVLELI